VSFARKVARNQMRMAMKEDETTHEEAEEAEEDSAEEEPLAPEEIESLIIDAEVLVRTGAEKIDLLIAAGVLDEGFREKIDEICNALAAKIEEM
jgi:hypothetical protein